jgi:hypothetical protein
MPESSRNAMPDIISAKCFGCGHVVKVPAALGGKKARCPKCTNTIVIPAQSEGGEDVVGDEMLPEVARDGEIPEDEEGGGESAGPASPPAERIRPHTAVRRGTSSSTNNPRMGGRAQQGGRGGQARRGAPPSKSNTPVIIGVVVGVLVLIIVAVAMSKSGDSKMKPKSSGSKTADKAAEVNSEDRELEQQCRGYIQAVNGGDDRKIMKFYTYDSEGERAVRRAVSQLIESQAKYENVEFKSSSAASGTTTFAYSGGQERTISWKKVDGVWLIQEK